MGTRCLFVVVSAVALSSVSLASAQSIPHDFGTKTSQQDSITVSNASIDRVHDWLEAIGDHAPGASDAALTDVASWPQSDLQTLWINVTVMLVLMDEVRAPGFSVSVGGLTLGKRSASGFTITPEGRPAKEIRYTPVQLRRLRLYACAAVAAVICPEMRKTDEPALGLDRLTEHAAAARKSGDVNFVLRRGAMLHADVAMSGDVVQPFERRSSPAPQQMRLSILDGAATDDVEIAIHWILGRLLLDDVIPAGSKKPAPGRDALVRDWYRATTAWMQNRESHDTAHLDRARELFPRDSEILFLSGRQREAFAAPRIHAALGAAAVPPGFAFDVGSDRAELRRAETYFRRALDVDPAMAEAHLHLGHVLLAKKEYKDAADHLRRAAASPPDDQLEYYRSLFLGAAEAGLAHDEAARGAYGRAAELRPEAQSPLLALSELATRRGDRATALRELQRVFALPPYAPERDDPWWDYFTSHARNANWLVEKLRADLGESEPR